MSGASRSDSDVIAASLVNPSEFGLIYERYYDTIYTYVARRVGEPDSADITAEVFARAFEKRVRYDMERDRCAPWLYGIARNTSGDRFRWMKYRRRRYLFPDSEVPLEEEATPRLAAQSTAADLHKAVDSLSVNDRDALLLHAVEGLSYQEVAVVVGVPKGTVGSRINRARRLVCEAIPDLAQRTGRSQVQTRKDVGDD